MDFFTAMIAASKVGYFSIDHNVARRELHAKLAERRRQIDAAYVALGWDQRAIYRAVEVQVATELAGSGVWPKSSGRYDELRWEFDRDALSLAGDAEALSMIGNCWWHRGYDMPGYKA